MSFSLVEFILVSLIVFVFGLLVVSLYNDVISDKITLKKAEWVCTQRDYKVSVVGGKVYLLGDCVTYVKGELK